MKRLVIISLVVVALSWIFSLNAVSGAMVCDDDRETLFKLSDMINAHGGEWNQTGYSEEICYNNYFAGDYLDAWPNPHPCDGTNLLLRFSDIVNSHAQTIDESSPFYFDVCYGDLNCTMISSGNCSQLVGGALVWSVIVSLSDVTNAHISKSDYYGQQVCCKSDRGVQSLCDYDGICEPEFDEDPFNCPTDCYSVCGDGSITGLELCDIGLDGVPGRPGGGVIDDVVSVDCTHESVIGTFTGGNLSCESGCLAYKTNECIISSDCGDGSVTDPEECDPPWSTGSCTLPDGRAGNRSCTLSCAWGACNPDGTTGFCEDGTIDAGEECDGLLLDGEDCESQGYLYGNLSCYPQAHDDECTLNVTQCVGEEGFCEDNAPFLYQLAGGGEWYAPSNCAGYNSVYPSDPTERELLCLYDCVPGASEPINNGYGGVPLTSWGCAWDEVADECYFSFVQPGNTDECRIDYLSMGECNSEEFFRTVELTAQLADGSGAGSCDAGCGAGVTCTSQIPCPKVVQLAFFGAAGFVWSLIIISLIYIYYETRKK